MAYSNPLGTLFERRDPPAGLGEQPARSAGGDFSCLKDITGSRFLTCVYEGTGEAVIVFQGSLKGPERFTPEEKELAFLARFCDDQGELDEALLMDDAFARRAENLARANRRAVTEARRFCVANALTKMWTLTYALEASSKDQIKRDVNDFMQKWRRLQGENFPYLYVIEEGGKNGRLHVHVAVPKFFTLKWKLERAWGHGFVQFSEGTRKSGEPRDDARRLALYLVKYLIKSIDDGHEFGEHRYERAEGFAVKVTRRSFSTWREANDWLENFAGECFRVVWSDYEHDDWQGPPTWVCRSG